MTALLHSRLLQSAGFGHGFGTRRTEPAGYPRDVHILKQVHGERIVVLTTEGGRRKEEGGRDFQDLEIRFRELPAEPFRFEEGDALVTDIPGTAIGIRTADCLPVLVGDTATGVAAAIHCGWRSLALGLAEKAIRVLLELTRSDATLLVAALGPSIGPCCYEVGEEVRKRFGESGFGGGIFLEKTQGLFLDLPAAARIQLQAAGLPPDSIDEMGGCTSCEPKMFWSFRARRDESRMVSWIRAVKGKE